DETPPEFIETYPKTSNESNTQFDIVVQLNEVGHIYYIVIPDGSKTPDKDQVKAGVDYDTVILITSGSFEVTAPGTGFSTTLSGLDAGTSYDVYLVAEDDATTPNLQDIPVKVEVTTTSNPTLELTYPTGGETFYHGDTFEVTWNSEFIDNVRLYRSSDGTGYLIIEESADAATGMLELIVPNNAGTDDILIRIASVLDTTLYDESGYFHLIDTLDPEIDSLYPENDEIDVGPGRNLAIHFNENVFPGTGNITIKRLSDGSTIEEIDVTDVDLVTVEEERVNIDPANALDEGITYFVEIDKGAFVDEVDSAFAGISGSSYWTFTTADYTAPVFMPGYPTISNVRDTSVDIVVKMDEVCLVYYLVLEDGAPEPTIGEVKAGNSMGGSITETSDTVSGLKPGTGYDIYFVAEDDATIPNTQNAVTKVDVTTTFTLELTNPSGGEIYNIGDSLTVTWISANIDSILLEEYDFKSMNYFSIVDKVETIIGEYTIFIPADPKKDSMKIRISAIDNPNVFDESGIFYIMDNLPPVIDSLAPADNATNVSLYSRVKIYFNEDIEKGNGTISIVKKPDTIFETFNITGDSVYLEEKKIVLSPSKPFDPGTEYYIIIDSATIKDIAGNAYPGIFNDTTYNFKTTRSELYISEYIEGSSFNKAIELYNNSGATIDLSGYALWIIYNGGDWSEGESNA
ncbi:MAG: Ig-like domain-containing protein, partial [Bacteroidales bacterium]|nr:Ig-like domain-containing protein [Bacteroidales bacterium]